MTPRNILLNNLRQAVGAENVLTDPEDILVYSFEHFFQERRFPGLVAVVRVANEKQLKRVEDLPHGMDIALVRRTASKQETDQLGKTIVLIDDALQPDLKVIDKNETKKQASEFQKELEGTGHGTFRNFALGLKSFFSGLPAQKCLDCKVCSGYCTVASSFKGVETWSSKGRTLLTRALSSGELQPSPKLVDVLYTCSLCGLCFADCFESTQVRKAIMDARQRLVKSQHTPELFAATAKNVLEVGDPSGMQPNKRVSWTERVPQKGVFPKRADILYWAGCVGSTRTPNVALALANILNRAEAEFTFLREKEGCCGYVLFATGLWNQARENAVGLVERVKETGAEALVTTCAGCYYTFTKMYPEILDIELPCQVLHSSQYVERLIEDERIVPHGLDVKMTYHDPCSLGRHSNVYQPPRNVLKAVPNLDFVEMSLNQNRARCCGAGGGLWSFNNSVASDSAVERLVKDVAPLGVSALATACPTCHINFRNASVKKGLGIRVYDLMEIVESATASVPKA